MSEIKYFKNLQEYSNYYMINKTNQKAKYMIINSIRDNIRESLVFTLSNNTAYYFLEFQVLEDDKILPKNQYSLKNMAYCGCEQYNKPTDKTY